MSDSKPTITVTRGKKNSSRRRSASANSSRAASGWGLPGPGAVVAGVIRGTRAAWWAGLGLLDVAQSAGAQVFDALVEEGKSWEQARRERTAATANRVRQATEQSEAIEAVEDRVHKEVKAALRRIGVPPREEVNALRQQIDALGKRVEALQAEVVEDETQKDT